MCLVVMLDPHDLPGRCVAEACLLAGEGDVVIACVPLEVPLDMPLETPLPEAEELARETLALARAIGSSYAVDIRARVVRTRAAGQAVVEEAERARAETIVVSMHRGERLGVAPEYVLRNARCRVLVAAL